MIYLLGIIKLLLFLIKFGQNIINIAKFLDFSHYLQKYNDFEQKFFGQKFVVLAHSEGCKIH
jgi:hypothetical protein